MNSQFVFVACKIGYENACKNEVLNECQNLRFSFSRPGFLTFKVAEGAADFSRINRLTFARTSGLNIGKCALEEGELSPSANEGISGVIEEKRIEHIHYWNRTVGAPDDDVILEYSDQRPDAIDEFASEFAKKFNLNLNQPAPINQWVLDLIEVDPGSIWYSCHQVQSPQQCWPGGIIRFSRPDNLVSRAYLKTREAMIWSRFPFGENETCIEIGCAPGGSAQALLESGLKVIGIDPADVDESINSHENFEHVKKRSADVRKKSLGEAKWLFADSNVAPQYTLDSVEDIATNQHVHLKGMILTLKLLEPKLVTEIPKFRERIQSMGFQYVKTRQLAFNRNEICLAALKRKSILRFGMQRSNRKPQTPDASSKPEGSPKPEDLTKSDDLTKSEDPKNTES